MAKMVKAMALCALASAAAGALAQGAPAKSDDAVFIVQGQPREGYIPAPDKKPFGGDGPNAVPGGAPQAAKPASPSAAPKDESLASEKAPKEMLAKLSAFYGDHLARMDVQMEAAMQCGVDAKAAKPTPESELAARAAAGGGEPARFKAQLDCLTGFKSRLPGRVRSQQVSAWVDKPAFEAAYQEGLKSEAASNLGWQRVALKVDSYWQIASLEAGYAPGVEQAAARIPALESGVWAGVAKNREELAQVKAFSRSTAAPAELAAAESMADNIGGESFQALQALYVANNVGRADAASRAAEKGDKKPLESFGAQFDAWMGQMVATKVKP